MPARKLTRTQETVALTLRAVGFGAILWASWRFMGVKPAAMVPIVAIMVGGLALVSATAATVATVVLISAPVVLINPLLGITALVLGLLSVRFLGVEGGRAFLAIGLTIAGAVLGPVWGGVVLGAFLLGPAEGALAAAFGAVLIEGFGLATGRPSIGVVLTGGPCSPLLRLPCPAPLTSPDWISRVVAGVNAQAVAKVFATAEAAQRPAALALQPALWAAAAVLVGFGAREARRRRNPVLAYGAAGLGVAVLAAGTWVLRAGFGRPMGAVEVAFATVTSLAVALIGVAVSEHVFAPPKPVQVKTGTAADDAEVDELLRLIASAEETLAERHTLSSYVLMTDMKSFSAMTEQDGSLASAKAIQKHRDLLLPVVENHGGTGKPSGGDGLVAAFDSADGALEAAAEMQRVMDAYNRAHQGDRPMQVRVGVAWGEVVVDRSGRPFIGVGLNLAARVMGLADGGQSFATQTVADAASAPVTVRPLGVFELKNIATPVEVVEILWRG